MQLLFNNNTPTYILPTRKRHIVYSNKLIIIHKQIHLGR